MSRTYIGPFGRILPVPDDHEPSSPDQPQPSSDEDSKMGTFQLPPPNLPTRLQFGSDLNPAYPQSRALESRRQTLVPHDQPRISVDEQQSRMYKEQLPPVSQLLTPGSGSQPSIPPSPYSPRESPGPSQSGPTYEFGQRSYAVDASGPLTSFHHQGPYSQSGAGSQNRTAIPPGEDSTAGPARPRYSSSYSVPQQTPARYPLHDDYPRQSPYASHPRPIAPSNPVATFQQAQSSVQANHPPALASLPSRRDASNPVRPQPKVVGEDDVPGEGPSWVYDDGTTCKKIIDGEEVIPEWGITKAGKPRKRLAIACTTCREKKIKCEPAMPKCVQCEKFNRDCKFATAPRGGQAAIPESPSYDSQARISSILNSPVGSPKTQTPQRGPTVGRSPPSKRKCFSPGSNSFHKRSSTQSSLSDDDPKSQKRRKDHEEDLVKKETQDHRPHRLRAPLGGSSEMLSTPTWGDIPTTTFDWRNDPYEVDPEVTIFHLNLYFLYTNTATYCMFPREPFFYWIRSSRDKSPNDLMVIYSILTMGSIYSEGPRRKTEGCLFAKTARFAVEKSHGKFSLQLAQSRLLLSFYHFALGDSTKAWDYCGSSLRVVAGLKLNCEDGITDVDDEEMFEYSLNRHALVECHRRTFWSAYLMDRFNGFCSGHLSFFNNEDIFTRLPAEDDLYNCQRPTHTQQFQDNVDEPSSSMSYSPMGPMAYLAQISSIWGDVLAHIYRASQMNARNYKERYDSFYQQTNRRLDAWMRTLPDHLTYCSRNTNESVREGASGTYLILHCLYHNTIMKLNRHVRHAHVDAGVVKRNMREAMDHAWQLLNMIQRVITVNQDVSHSTRSTKSQRQQLQCAFSAPFTGFAVLTAIDIIGGGGPLTEEELSKTIPLMESGLVILDEISRFWASARAQRKAIMQRIEKLVMAASEAAVGGKKAWIATGPMEKTFGATMDVYYPNHVGNISESVLYLKNLGVHVREDEILVVKT